MPKTQLSVPHNLGAEEAKRRITRLASESKGQLGGMITDVEESWSDNQGQYRFRVMKMSVAARLDVEATRVRVEIEYPLAALPLKGRIEKQILEKAGVLLS